MSYTPQIWAFVKHKYSSSNKDDRETYIFFCIIFWYVFWIFFGILVEVASAIFIIPFIILSLIGIAGIIIITKQFIKNRWSKYFPEYQDFKQEYKPKRKPDGEQMVSIYELFEDDWDAERRRAMDDHADAMRDIQERYNDSRHDAKHDLADAMAKIQYRQNLAEVPPAPDRPCRDVTRM